MVISSSNSLLLRPVSKLTTLEMTYSCNLSYMAIIDYHGLSRNIMDNLGLSLTILDYLGLFWTILDYLGISWDILGYLGLGHYTILS